MTISAFIDLSAAKKRSIVLREGAPIAAWTNSLYKVFLFQLSQFYVETYCYKESKDIHEFRVIPGPEQLSYYLDQISLEGLLKS